MVFTCVTDTGQLQCSSDDKTKLYCLDTLLCSTNEPAVNFNGIFVLKLINTIAIIFKSTATAHNVSLNNDGLNITCISDINNPENTFETDSLTIGLYYARQ